MKDIEKILITLQLIPDVSAFDQSLMLGERRYLVTQIPADLNAIRELELLVMEKFGAYEYGEQIKKLVRVDDDYPYSETARMMTTDAATRIAAMLAVIEEAGK